MKVPKLARLVLLGIATLALRARDGEACNKGYTLIELLIVLFIISIVTSVGLLSISRNENKRIEAFAEEMVQILELAEEQAMLEPNILGLSFIGHTYQFSKLQIMDNKSNQWISVGQDKVLGAHAIPAQIDVVIDVGKTHSVINEDIKNAEPTITISTNGDITPFALYLSKKGEKPRYVITGEADGHINSQCLS